MFCDRCGTNIPEAVNFCPSCGKSIKAAPLVPAHGRIAGHVRLLGIFWIALSAFHLIPGLAILSAYPMVSPYLPPGVPNGLIHGVLTTIGWSLLLTAILGLITGWGLLQRERWARTLAIVMGCFSLVNMPFGTALGIYTLWVLLPAASEQEYRETARPA